MSMRLFRRRHGAVMSSMDATRSPLWAVALALALAALGACSETSLTDAPVVDLSTQAGVRGVKPPPMAIPASPGEALYTVKKGDTLFHLAADASTTMQDLARWNGLDVHAPIFVGQQLRLQPPAGSNEVASDGGGAAAPTATTEADGGAGGEVVATPIPLSGGNGVETRALEAAPGAAAPAPAAGASGIPPAPGSAAAPPAPPAAAPMAVPGASSGGAVAAPPPIAPPPMAPAPVAPAPATVPAPAPAGGATAPADAAALAWIWPVEGAVTGRFDPQRGKGIEIAAPADAPVVAVADGTVSYVGSPRDYGNLIILKHGDELLSVYAHNKTLLVKEGQAVRRGQTIATAGGTPNVPPTLHFEVRRNHVAIDPLGVLPLR